MRRLAPLHLLLLSALAACYGGGDAPPPAGDDDDGAAETDCGDSSDNDGDGLFNCADPDCAGVSPCGGDDDTASDDDSVPDDDTADDDSVGDDDDATDDDDSVGDDDAGDDDGVPGAELSCGPATTQITATSAAAGTAQLHAYADLGAGPVEVFDGTWSVAQGGGTVSASGLYTSSVEFGGEMLIEVERELRTAFCTVEVSFEGDVNDSPYPGAPAAADSAGSTTSASCQPTIVYPLAGSAMPGSFRPPLVQWNPSSGAYNLHGLTFASTLTSVTVWTAATSYQPDDTMWEALTQYDPANTVVVTVQSGIWAGSTFQSALCESDPVAIEVTDHSINGWVIYWAPPVTKRIDLDQNGNTTVALPSAICHGCHNVNLANPVRMSYGPNIPSTTNIIDLSNPGTVISSMGGDYGALNPDGTRIVVGGLFGGLTLHNATTGANLGAVSTPSGTATMPTWSPDGSTLVYASCDGVSNSLQGIDCDLYKQSWNGSAFSGETLLASAPSGATYYYPTFSPDSQWIAFNHATPVPDSDGGDNWTNNNPTADLRLVHVSGSPMVILSAANGTGDLTNSWPRWAPAFGNYAWLAWASKRPYGNETTDISQLWVSAIDLSAASAALDPSLPPVWLPGQSTSEGNHTPTWVPRLGP